ncbi:hypothetical protein Scep_011196 [Stephania cephalantha]|uniref:PPIase cyclophilin-type domain-containing protein n=1 Tax=Stephania cephalantha TaxID=152367 RepID=A0AAP0JCV9_9MAGN
MAILLSSANAFPSISLRRSSFTCPRRKLGFLPIQSAFRLYDRGSEIAGTISARFRILCVQAKKTRSHESSDPANFPLISHGTVFSNGIKLLRRAFAIVFIFIQLSSPLPLGEWDRLLISSSEGVLYSPDTKVPRTGELALRRAIPANTNMKAIQDSLEEISYLLRIPQRKPFGTMEGNVKKALKGGKVVQPQGLLSQHLQTSIIKAVSAFFQIANEEKESILAAIPTELRDKASSLYASLLNEKGGLQSLLKSIKDQDPDKVSVALASSLDTVAEVELLQAPGLSFLLPEQYLKYPRLTGRGIVEFTIEKGDGSTFSPAAGGEPRSFGTVQVVIDGYSAPLTAGNFAKLAIDGAYDGVKLICTDQAILSGNSLGEQNSGYGIPLEIKPSGQFEPLYRTTLSVQDGELPALPLSVYGAVAMAHSDVSEEYSSPFQFFFYLYDKRNAGLGGLSFDEGQFSVFGYTTAGKELLSQIKTGDLIRSAKLIEGQDRLILPEEK